MHIDHKNSWHQNFFYLNMLNIHFCTIVSLNTYLKPVHIWRRVPLDGTRHSKLLSRPDNLKWFEVSAQYLRWSCDKQKDEISLQNFHNQCCRFIKKIKCSSSHHQQFKCAVSFRLIIIIIFMTWRLPHTYIRLYYYYYYCGLMMTE